MLERPNSACDNLWQITDENEERDIRVLDVYSSVDEQLGVLDQNLSKKVWISEENHRNGSFVDARKKPHVSPGRNSSVQ